MKGSKVLNIKDKMILLSFTITGIASIILSIKVLGWILIAFLGIITCLIKGYC